MNIEIVRNALSSKSIKDFDDINNQVILGASNHIKMIGQMIEEIAYDSIEKKQTVEEMINRIKIVTDFFIATRGEASQAITNAIYLMINGINKYNNSYNVSDVSKYIIETKNKYQVISKNAIDKAVEFATNLLSDKENIFIFDYSSTVEKVLVNLNSGEHHIYIAESRVIDGGKPFIKTCLEKNYKITYFADASLMHFLRKCDVALMGAETFYPDGTGFNTVGSDIVGLVCHEYKIPLYFITPMIKVDKRPLMGKKKNIVYNNVANKLKKVLDESLDLSNIDFTTPELLGVPSKHIEAFITEYGVIPSESMYDISVKYIEEIRGDN